MTSGSDSTSSASSPLPERIELKITSDPANLRDVRKRVETFSRSIGMPPEKSDEIGLALNEALANVIRHGYDGAHDRPIIVSAERGDGELHVLIRDWAKPFDPALVKPKILGKLSPGGVGMLCIHELMDHVKFERLSDGMLLKMTKNMTTQKPETPKTTTHDKR
jgi:anti-sigma regulatory factor (Ser/Thr protein kinase)